MLKDDIDQFYRDSFNGAEKSYFYISDAGKCQRALYFQFKNAPRQEPSPRMLRVFDEGDYAAAHACAGNFRPISAGF